MSGHHTIDMLCARLCYNYIYIIVYVEGGGDDMYVNLICKQFNECEVSDYDPWTQEFIFIIINTQLYPPTSTSFSLYLILSLHLTTSVCLIYYILFTNYKSSWKAAVILIMPDCEMYQIYDNASHQTYSVEQLFLQIDFWLIASNPPDSNALQPLPAPSLTSPDPPHLLPALLTHCHPKVAFSPSQAQ